MPQKITTTEAIEIIKANFKEKIKMNETEKIITNQILTINSMYHSLVNDYTDWVFAKTTNIWAKKNVKRRSNQITI